jgi:hypothetical protein
MSNEPSIADFAARIRNNIEGVFLGKTEVVDMLITAFLARGHVLLEDVPGTGKTILARAFAGSAGRWAQVKHRGTAPVLAGAGALILVYLFSPFFILQFISFFLFFIIIGSKMYSASLLRNLYLVRREGDLRNFRYEWVKVELAVENCGRLPAFMLAVSDSPGRLSVFRNNKSLRTLRGRSRLVISWQGHCSNRGIFNIGPASIRGSDPLGLFPFFAAAPETTRLVVYPPPGQIALRSPGGIPQGTRVITNPLYEDVTRWRSLREYQAGDEVRRINWKATARNITPGSPDEVPREMGALPSESERVRKAPGASFNSLLVVG